MKKPATSYSSFDPKILEHWRGIYLSVYHHSYFTTYGGLRIQLYLGHPEQILQLSLHDGEPALHAGILLPLPGHTCLHLTDADLPLSQAIMKNIIKNSCNINLTNNEAKAWLKIPSFVDYRLYLCKRLRNNIQTGLLVLIWFLQTFCSHIPIYSMLKEAVVFSIRVILKKSKYNFKKYLEVREPFWANSC